MATWNYLLSVQELVNLSEKQSMDCFTDPNYDFLPDQFSHFDSSLSSIVSSPAPNNNLFLPKLIENSRNLSQIMNNDLHKYRNPVSLPPVFPSLLAGKNQSPYSDGNSSVSELVKSGTKSSKSNCQSNSRKRKTASLGNSKEVMEGKANEIDNAKRSKVIEENGKVYGCGKKEGETKSGKNYSGEEKSEKPENGKQKPPKITKDYIHVRARRGQATDSHSLAERVRREKISERMKLLVDLVPGCNKATGKAMMLDEIINYVQALQRQVEFLSMKLASVNPETSSVEDRLVPNGLYSSKQQQAPPK